MILGNRYEVHEKLGQGGMGEVFKGHDSQTNSPVAIKQLRGTVSNDESVIERFRREAQALRDLNHPNIVKMLDMIQQDDDYYLITEYIEGGDLADALHEKGQFTVEETLKIGLELADALSRTHHLGIIHRDIKPANVLLAADGTPRLTDFGVAHMESKERLTGTGMAIGTMDYLPPEAISGDAVDARADVWSFGIMLYEMLTGHHPFHGETRMQILTNILQNPAPDLTDEFPDAPEELAALLQQMLEKDRETRIRSARQVGAVLEAILNRDESGLRRMQTPSRASSRIAAPVTVDTGQEQTPVVQDTLTTAVFSVGQKTRQPMWIFLGIAFVIVLAAVGGVALKSALAPEPTATPSPTPTPEPTATLAPIMGDAPAGYRWESVDELQFVMPGNWVRVPSAVVSSTFSLAEDHEWTDALFTALEQKRTYALYIDWTVLIAVVVSIEDTPIILPDEALLARAEALARPGNSMPIEVAESIELPVGTAYFVRDDRPPLGEDDEIDRLDNYNFYDGETLYSVTFTGTAALLEDATDQINAVLASLQIGDMQESGPSPVAPQDAPVGYKWVNVDEVRMLVPVQWINVPIETLLEISANFLSESDGTDFIMEYLSRLRTVAVYSSLIDFSGTMVTIEDTGIVLPESVLLERIEQLIFSEEATFTEELRRVETRLGTAYFTAASMTTVNNGENRNNVEAYIIYRGTTLYLIGFSAMNDDFEAKREIFDTIFNSIQIDEISPTPSPEPQPTAEPTAVPTAEASVEPGPDDASAIAPVVITNMPDGWQVAQGEYTAFAVPQGFLVTTGLNQSMLEASLGLVMGNLNEVDEMTMLFEQMTVDALAGRFQGTDLFFGSSMVQESILSTDLDTANAVVQGLFSIVSENQGLEISFGDAVRVTLPAGEAIRSDMQLSVAGRPPFRTVYYIILREDGLKLYALAFTFLDSEIDRLMPLVEEIAQTLVILK